MGYFCPDKNMADALSSLINSLEQKFWTDFRLQCERSPFSIEFWVRDGGKDIAHFELKEMPNCCGILISTRTWVIKEHQGKGLAQEMMLLKESLARKYGYTMLMATVNLTSSLAEAHILEKFGWTLNNSFINSRTKNTVGIYTKDLSKL